MQRQRSRRKAGVAGGWWMRGGIVEGKISSADLVSHGKGLDLYSGMMGKSLAELKEGRDMMGSSLEKYCCVSCKKDGWKQCAQLGSCNKSPLLEPAYCTKSQNRNE